MDTKYSFYDKDSSDKSYTEGIVFVGMSFSDENMNETYTAISDECKRLGLIARRVDQNTGSGLIIRDIIDLIEESEFIIIDLSYERPNVYYELGYAHGVGNDPIDILLIAKEGTEIHFNLRGHRIEFYKSTENLRQIIKSRLETMIEETRNN